MGDSTDAERRSQFREEVQGKRFAGCPIAAAFLLIVLPLLVHAIYKAVRR